VPADASTTKVESNGSTLRWQALDGAAGETPEEPDTDPGSRLLLDLLAPFVPEEML
jgi:hypothetical protein